MFNKFAFASVRRVTLFALLAVSLLSQAACMQAAGNADTAHPAADVKEYTLAADVSLYEIKAEKGCRVTTNNVVVGRNADGAVVDVELTSDTRPNQVCGLVGELFRGVPGVAGAMVALDTIAAK